MTLEASFARTRTESSLRPSPSASAWQPLHNPIAPASFNAAMSEAAIMAAMGLPTGFKDNRLPSGSPQPRKRKQQQTQTRHATSPDATGDSSSGDESSALNSSDSSEEESPHEATSNAIAASSSSSAAAASSADSLAAAFPVPPASVTSALQEARLARRRAAKQEREERRKKRKTQAEEEVARSAEASSASLSAVAAAPAASSSAAADHESEANGVDTHAEAEAEVEGEYGGEEEHAAAAAPKLSKSARKKAAKEARRRLAERQSSQDRLKTLAAANHTEVKYWAQRYSLFSRFDDGCRLDRVGWFSVTPESIAAHQAERCRCDTIIDAYAGVGGNAIQFAFTCAHVIAIEIDPDRLALAKHNATVYGVADRIEFICGDYLQLLPGLKADAVFLAPPWGGVEYSNVKEFDIDTMIYPSGFEIFQRTLSITPNIAYCLPRNIQPAQVAHMATLPPRYPEGRSPPPSPLPPLPCELEENCVHTKVKMMTAYFGELVQYPSEQEEEQQQTEPAAADAAEAGAADEAQN